MLKKSLQNNKSFKKYLGGSSTISKKLKEDKIKTKDNRKEINNKILLLKNIFKESVDKVDKIINNIDKILINNYSNDNSYNNNKYDAIIFRSLVLKFLKDLKKYNKKINLIKNIDKLTIKEQEIIIDELNIFIKEMNKIKLKLDEIFVLTDKNELFWRECITFIVVLSLYFAGVIVKKGFTKIVNLCK